MKNYILAELHIEKEPIFERDLLETKARDNTVWKSEWERKLDLFGSWENERKSLQVRLRVGINENSFTDPLNNSN